MAQVFTDATAQPIGDSTACPGAVAIGTNTPNYLTRTFTVSGMPVASDVSSIDVGLIATHDWRGDIGLRLTNPNGDVREIIVPDTSGTGDIEDYNIELVDGVTPTVNETGAGGNHTTPDDTTLPPYENTVAPDVPISDLITGPMNGNWVLELCDDYYGSDPGGYLQSSLTFTTVTDADMSLDVVASNELPGYGGTITVTYTVSNDGPATQSASTVSLAVPAGATVNSTTPSSGTVSGSTWTLPALAPGDSETLTLNVTVGSASVTFAGEIATAAQGDVDSTPGNGSTTEDDDDSVQIIPQPPGTVAPLSCSIGEVYSMAWTETGTNSWPVNTLTNTYSAVDTDAATADIPITLTMSAPGGNAAANAFFAGAATQPSPRTRTGWTGGVGGAAALYVGVAFPDLSTSSRVDMTMDLGIPAEGVEGFQFTLTDIDQGTFVDRITVTGSADGVPVATPTLTPGSNVIISGNSAFSQNTGNQPPASSLGNLTVTFNTPVDKIVFGYDNAPGAQANPLTQAIALQDLSICRRLLPDVLAEKTVEIYDPSNLGLYMTPGNEVLYTISVVNRGPLNSGVAEAEAGEIYLEDTLPTNLKFVEATDTFSSGNFVDPVPPNTDCAVTPCVVKYDNATLGVDESGSVIVRALIK